MPYPELMKLHVAPFALLPILAITAAITVRHANAQVRVPRNPILPIADYHLIHGSENTYRFNSKTGMTQELMITTPNLAGNSSHYVWSDISESASTPAIGDIGRYDVVEGNGAAAALVRIDRATGKSWGMVSGLVPIWKEISTF